ncbi:hypothetical protein EI052_23330 [Escherichia coli]|nr:hypothetical protein [Escherichia coli]MQL00472.1 hypothetical protein [Escherichia coli]MQL41148.1 hypothetical protein [Escherichia coli]
MCNDTLHTRKTNSNAPECGNTTEASNQTVIRGNSYGWIRGLTLSGTKTHVKQRFLPLTPLLMVSDVLWSPVLPA